MGEEHGLLKSTASGCDSHRESNPGKGFVKAFFRRLEGEGNKAGTEFRYSDSELSGDPIAEIARAELGKGEPSRGHDQDIGLKSSPGCVNDELVSFLDLPHVAVGEDSDSGFATFALQHSDDLT